MVEVTTDKQFEKTMPSFWAAYTDPRNALMELIYPVKRTGPDALKDAMEKCKKRMLASWHASAAAHYIQILDSDDNDTVVGSALWNIFDAEHNPYGKPSDDKSKPGKGVDWWPEGSDIQRFTAMALQQLNALKAERQRRPHLCEFLYPPFFETKIAKAKLPKKYSRYF